MGDLMVDNKKSRTGKTGMRGIPQTDKHLDRTMYVDDNPNSRKGIFKCTDDLVSSLEKCAADLKISRSEVIRKALTSFCRYQEDAKAFGRINRIIKKINADDKKISKLLQKLQD